MLRFGLVLGVAIALAVPQVAAAEDPPAVAAGALSSTLMDGLAKHSQALEEMKLHGAFTFSGRFEQVEDDGKTTDVKELSMRSTPAGPRDRVTKIFKYIEDGKDKTTEQQKKADERRAKRKEEATKEKDKKGNDIKMPFLASEQGRYIFSVAERDPANANRVRVNFNPKKPAEDAIKGSAWVDETKKEVLSMGFSLSENPTFVDHVNVTIAFGLPTALGPAPSSISFEAKGGFLFIHKRYRGSGTFTDPAVVP